MSEFETRPPTQNDAMYVLRQNEQATELIQARVVGNEGPRSAVIQDTGEGSYTATSEHRANIFTPQQVAITADDLLPMPKDGEERLMSSALKEIIDKPESRNELIMRLAGVAMGERMNAERRMSDYGVRSLEDVVGSPDELGSNMWKVEDLIDLGNQGRDASNTLILARPEEEELSNLSVEEATKIRQQISASNRGALDNIYDYYDVSFSNAAAYETTLRDGRTLRATVYPSATESVYFVERVIGSGDTTPNDVEIRTTVANFQPENGYIRVV